MYRPAPSSWALSHGRPTNPSCLPALGKPTPVAFLPREACRPFLLPRATRFLLPCMSSSPDRPYASTPPPLAWSSMSPYRQTSPNHVPSPLFLAAPTSKSPITQLRIPWPLHKPHACMHAYTTLVMRAKLPHHGRHSPTTVAPPHLHACKLEDITATAPTS